jgi:hypothetical protein
VWQGMAMACKVGLNGQWQQCVVSFGPPLNTQYALFIQTWLLLCGAWRAIHTRSCHLLGLFGNAKVGTGSLAHL